MKPNKPNQTNCCNWLQQLVFLCFFLIPRVLELFHQCKSVESSSFLFSGYIESVMSSFSYKALYIVIYILVLGSIYLSFSHFKNGRQYVRWRTAQVFIILNGFLLQSLVLRSFLFLKFSFSPRILMFSLFHHHHHQQVTQLAKISLTLSLSLSIYPYHPSLPVGLPEYILCLHRTVGGDKVLAGQPTLIRPYERVHWKMSLISLSLLLQQCLTYLFHLMWIVLELRA